MSAKGDWLLQPLKEGLVNFRSRHPRWHDILLAPLTRNAVWSGEWGTDSFGLMTKKWLSLSIINFNNNNDRWLRRYWANKPHAHSIQYNAGKSSSSLLSAMLLSCLKIGQLAMKFGEEAPGYKKGDNPIAGPASGTSQSVFLNQDYSAAYSITLCLVIFGSGQRRTDFGVFHSTQLLLITVWEIFA